MGDSHSVLFSAALFSSCRHTHLWLLWWNPSISYLLFLFSCSFYLFSSVLVFSEEPCLLMLCLEQAGAVSPALLTVMFQAPFALEPTCSFSCWSRVSLQLSYNIMFPRDPFFPSTRLLHCPPLAFTHRNWEYKGVDSPSLGL